MFLLGKLFWTVAQPGNLLLLGLSAGILWLLVSARRRGLGLVAAMTLALLAITILPVGDWLIAPLEKRFPSPALPPEITGIIVLGGAVDAVLSERFGQVTLNDAGERLTEAAVLARRYPAARILVVGGSGAMLPGTSVEADVMARLLVELGIDQDRIWRERRSRNTVENAILAKALAQPKSGETWLLVTSAAHMPRAVGCFRRVGWDVLAYPVDHHIGGELTPDRFELGANLVEVDHAMREWVGLIAYRLLGRIDTLYPGP